MKATTIKGASSSSTATDKNNSKTNKYHTPADYGQYDHLAKREEYEVYSKQNDDYDQYHDQDDQPDTYYYAADEYNQDEQENRQDNQSFEEVPNVKKAAAKAPEKQTQKVNNPPQKQSTQQQYQQQGEEEEDDDEEEQAEAEQNGGGEEYEPESIEVKQNEQQSKQQIIKKPVVVVPAQSKVPRANEQANARASNNREESEDEEENDETEGSSVSKAKDQGSNYLRSTKSFETRASLRQEEKSASSVSEPFDNIYNSKKYPLGIVDDPELEDQRKNLWKAFGRECAAGKELFSLYRSHQPAKIAYPKLKMKTAEELASKPPKDAKGCPQKTQIVYPPLSYKEVKPRFHKVDLIPKRKPEAEIRRELEDIQRNPYVPINRGVNRKQLIENLQQKFKYQRGGLPKAAELPYIDENKIVFNEEMVKAQAQKRVGLKNQTFTGVGRADSKADNETASTFDDPVAECNHLFNQIMGEIEERQEYLDSINHLKEAALKKKIKQEIIERVAELQKVTEIKQKYL